MDFFYVFIYSKKKMFFILSCDMVKLLETVLPIQVLPLGFDRQDPSYGV